ncbi:hypothetical protein [Phytomonospora endophytica]|uniref:Uncharacterized protein n=1 Tax=Phytomonospora endophytica TaxID=714109 RepID=A0A841FRB3_9ACTN|nr:hypothetical protein [Phytomonospora endophytica]MBB6038755.1 hypothetical protein [Phytomonospora endophytica]GIG68449.1 hypothetical protein Pen01_47440 [Phytomonospora endophytica]
MTDVARTSDIAAFDGREVTVRGRYAVLDMGRHRLTTTLADGTTLTSNRVAQIVFPDGGFVELGARPAEELDSLEGRDVAARGTLVASPPRQPEWVAQPDTVPTLMAVQEVLAD